MKWVPRSWRDAGSRCRPGGGARSICGLLWPHKPGRSGSARCPPRPSARGTTGAPSSPTGAPAAPMAGWWHTSGCCPRIAGRRHPMHTRSALFLMASGLAAGGCGVGSGTGIDSAPIVTITAPLDGATVGNNVNIAATVFDDFKVDKVRFLIDGAVIPNSDEFDPPFTYNWNTQTVTNNANHVIRVEATDNAGNIGFSQITVLVVRGTQ